MSYIRRRPSPPELIDPTYSAFCLARQLMNHTLASWLNTGPPAHTIDLETAATHAVVDQLVALKRSGGL